MKKTVDEINKMIMEDAPMEEINDAIGYIDTEFTTASRTAMLNQVLAGQPKVELLSLIHIFIHAGYKVPWALRGLSRGGMRSLR